MPDHGITQTDRRVDVEEFAPGSETPTAQQDARGNEQESEQENSREDQEQKDADVRVRRARKEKFVKPESYESRRAAGGQHSTGQRNGVLSEEVEKPRPASDGSA